MMKSIVAAAALAATCGFAVASSAAIAPAAFRGQELNSHAKLSIDQARTIALKTHPGVITDQELAKQPSGAGYQYAFNIKDHAGAAHVAVDAKTGQVLENAALKG